MGIGLHVSGGGIEIFYSEEGASRPGGPGGDDGGVPTFGPSLRYRRGDTSREFRFEEIGESETPVGRWLTVTLEEGSQGRRLFTLLFPALSFTPGRGMAPIEARTIGVEASIREDPDGVDVGLVQRGEYTAFPLEGVAKIEPSPQ